MTNRRTDQRRRRVIMDEMQQVDGSENPDLASLSDSPRPRRKVVRTAPRAYSPKASRRHQLKTTDLIPKRWSAWLLLIAALGSAVAALNLAAIYLPPDPNQADAVMASASPPSETTPTVSESNQVLQDALNLSSRHSVAAWYTSLLLILSSLASLQIYALRQHRSNDYRGTYRVWLWLAVILLAASLNCVVDLPAVIKRLSATWLDMDGAGAPWILATVQCVLLILIVVRGLIEVRLSPTSLVLVCFVWLAYSAAIALQIPTVAEFVVSNGQLDMAAGNCWILGANLTLIAALYYARLVFLQAAGLVADKSASPLPTAEAKKTRRKMKAQRVKTKPARSEAEDDQASEPATPSKTPPLLDAPAARSATAARSGSSSPLGNYLRQSPTTSASAPASQAASTTARRSAPTSSHPVQLETREPRMSKAERKRLKKEKRRAA